MHGAPVRPRKSCIGEPMKRKSFRRRAHPTCACRWTDTDTLNEHTIGALMATTSAQANEAQATLTPPEPDLTPSKMIARAVAMRSELIERQAEAEELNRYSPEMHQKF